MNAELAQHILDQLHLAGVAEVCVCPGGRNAPWVELLAAPGCTFKVTWHFEERAAAFFALGRTRVTARPVAVCTTSGTAAGELMPAAMEAFYSGSPLILLTADRPRRFRGSGAPQAAEQRGMFGVYAVGAFDLELDERLDLTGFEIASPVHINVCFEEPTDAVNTPVVVGSQTPVENPGRELTQFLKQVRNPLVIVGSLNSAERTAVERWLLALGAPVYAEAQSGLRESIALERLRLNIGDKLLERAAGAGYRIDGLLRVGGVPTHRLWRDLEDRHASLPVISVSRLPFSGLGRKSALCCGDVPEVLARAGVNAVAGNTQAIIAQDRLIAGRLTALLADERRSEPALFHALSQRIEPGATVYVGNSLPVREWDLAATWDWRGYDVVASRGLNGIDGQLSTFLGQCKPGAANWAILGDLTTLYDLSGPWVKAQLDKTVQANIVVINNAGGRLFDRMQYAKTPEFQNAHGLAFDRWAEMWGMPYQLCRSVDEISMYAQGIRVVELRPDPESTARFWRRYEECLA